ncbi:hypothetical protein RclHR1_02620023 [Rhizophagus clarus]|uniref:Uncharacterized protein n=1 Tax=Rhizophagus clarus TaxID=94130 RepID=A0A2Z6R4N6_9GLOM|nr:hypothetical protein RclHR1_02620023 [Rhizophagus clarus]
MCPFRRSRTSFQSRPSISKVQNTGSVGSKLHFEGLEHQCLFDFLFWIRPSVLKAYNTEVLELHFEAVQKKSGLYLKSRSWQYSSKIQEAVSSLIQKIQDYSISKLDSNYSKESTRPFQRLGSILKAHRFPEVKFQRSSASERILYEILMVHGFLSAF